MAGAVHQLASALGVTEAEAKILADGGMNSVEVVITVDPSDIADLIGCSVERAEEILKTAKNLPAKSTEVASNSVAPSISDASSS